MKSFICHFLVSACCHVAECCRWALSFNLSCSCHLFVIAPCHSFVISCYFLGIFHHGINLLCQKMTRMAKHDKMELPCFQGWGQAPETSFPGALSCLCWFSLLVCRLFGNCFVIVLSFFVSCSCRSRTTSGVIVWPFLVILRVILESDVILEPGVVFGNATKMTPK